MAAPVIVSDLVLCKDLMLVPSSYHSLADVQERMVVIGRFQRTETTSMAKMLDMSSKTWEEGVELSTISLLLTV